eukprot:g3428.t1
MVLAKQRAQKEEDARVLLKIQAVNAAKEHLANLVPNAKKDLKELAFPDANGLEIQRHFLPNLFKKVQEEVSSMKQAQLQIDAIAAEGVPVGPIQLSSADSIEELQQRVYAWLQTNEPKIAAGWPYGVELRLGGVAVQKTQELFEAKPGQISMGPQEPPPPPEPEGQEEEVDPEAS